MVFSSTIFLLYFLPIFLSIYHLVGKKFKNTIILVASLLFYAWGGPKFILVIVGSSVVNFYLIQSLYASDNVKKKKLLLWVSVCINVGLLLYFKYANFFIENTNEILGLLGIPILNWTKVVLPIGISFFTFQILTYSVDVYRNVHAPLKKVSDYLLYIMSFPQMIAGPIVRFSTVADDIENRKETIDDKLAGFYRFCLGLSKKVLIANVMGEQANLIMGGNLSSLNTLTAWLGIIAYTFQIYFDFAGYSDMAIGLGKMMGFTFPENFNNPYTSKSITEFWRRWHITLGTWMRDYLYIPLGGNRVSSKARLYFNLWIVFLLSGLWHGASWSFILWGAFHGFFLILDRLFLLNLLKKAGTLVSVLFTFIVVMVGWVIFRLEQIDEIGVYLSRLFQFEGFTLTVETIPSFYFKFILAILFSFITLFSIGKKLETFTFYRNTYSYKTNLFLSIGSVILFLMCIGSISSQGFNPFIYFRF